MKLDAVFFDRDGVINVDYGYVHSLDELHFVPGIFALCQSLPETTHKFIVTNQAGIARGYYSEIQFQSFMKTFEVEMMKRNIQFSDWRHCPHHPDYNGICECRKPHPGMIHELLSLYELAGENCALIGDNLSDIWAGQAAGLGLNILLTDSVATNHFTTKRSHDFARVTSLQDALIEIKKRFSL